MGITYGLLPYGGHSMGWTSPLVLASMLGGMAMLVVFCIIETRVPAPMFDLHLMKIRAFAAGISATLLASIARGGLQFMLIIWLQGIWLPLHGYDFVDTPLWAGIFLLPLTGGFVFSGPVSGWLSDKHGARWFASGGLLVSAAGVRRAAAHPHRLQLQRVRDTDLRGRRRDGPVLRPERGRDHEQRPGQAARRRLRHARHVPELRVRAFDRRSSSP